MAKENLDNDMKAVNDREAEVEKILREKHENEALAAKVKKKRTMLIIVSVSSVLIVLAAVALFTNIIKPQIILNQAKKQVNSGQYWVALKTLEQIGERQDVKAYVANSEILQKEIAFLARCVRGNTLTFGKYEQDADLGNGQEPIEWIIIGEEDHERILISNLVLDYQYFNTEQMASRDYDGSYLQHWLENDFMNTAFDPDERQRVSSVSLLASSSSIYSKTKTYNVVDLRLAEKMESAQPSPYAKSLGSNGSYALKSIAPLNLSSSEISYLYAITETGYESEYGVRVYNVVTNEYYYEKIGVRPVIRIDISTMPPE